jgi:uncharacterized protein YecE (DUF72 family)
MLPYYAERLSTVEINYTYYRTPNKKILAGWDAATPDRFKLTLKAPKRITHEARLKDCADRVQYFVETATTLGPKLGVLFFQLPPNLKQDLGVFDAFLAILPSGVVAAFEFRHGSWLNDELFERLQARNLALCVADSETMATPVQITADYAYFRLRDEGYTPEDIARWAQTSATRLATAGKCSCTSSTRKQARGHSSARLLLDALGLP